MVLNTSLVFLEVVPSSSLGKAETFGSLVLQLEEVKRYSLLLGDGTEVLIMD